MNDVARSAPPQNAVHVAASAPRRRRPVTRFFLLVVIPALALITAAYVYFGSGRYVGTDDAYVRADSVEVSPEISGRVIAVAVADNQRVAKGDVLFRIDETPFRMALDQAEANLRDTKNTIDAFRAIYLQKQEEEKLDEQNVAFFGREYDRQAALEAKNFAAQSKLDEARHNLDTAREALAALHHEMAGIAAGLDGDASLPAESHARYVEAKARRDRAALDLEHAVVKAPFDGIVASASNLQPGRFLAAGTPAFALVRADAPWIEANLKETELTHVAVGQKATVTIDAYPDREFPAHVASVSPATGAAFALLPAQNSTGNWVKVVQRVPVRIAIDSPDGAPVLRSGMSVEVTIDTGYRRAAPGLIKAARAWTGE